MACGVTAPQSTLVRIVRDGTAGLRPDAFRRAGGRGGYLHHDPACWARFAQRKGALRALRVAVDRPARASLVAALSREAGAREAGE
jgi:predicted RNA-binding protein YlxR (DUF448 family)